MRTMDDACNKTHNFNKIFMKHTTQHNEMSQKHLGWPDADSVGQKVDWRPFRWGRPCNYRSHSCWQHLFKLSFNFSFYPFANFHWLHLLQNPSFGCLVSTPHSTKECNNDSHNHHHDSHCNEVNIPIIPEVNLHHVQIVKQSATREILQRIF